LKAAERSFRDELDRRIEVVLMPLYIPAQGEADIELDNTDSVARFIAYQEEEHWFRQQVRLLW